MLLLSVETRPDHGEPLPLLVDYTSSGKESPIWAHKLKGASWQKNGLETDVGSCGGRLALRLHLV